MGFLPAVSKTVSFLTLGFLLLINCTVLEFGSHAQVLPKEEVQTLQTISNKLNITGWTINQDSCGSKQWNQSIVGSAIQTNVSCNCTFSNATVCHVTTFNLKGFNLTGVLPEELGNLPQVQEIDLSRNYISGSIPTSLAQLRNLRLLSLLGNRINGSIPQEIGNISTLESLVLEDNLLGGPLPQDLGNLINLRRLLLSANNFTGRIPETFGNLKNLSDFRIDGSALSGKIPEFFGNWTNMTRLDLQGTSMEGPIPSAISQLTNLTTLQISDLKGPSSRFPNLQGMKKMATLVLRSCLISDSIPEYLGGMPELKILDLSNNMLTGIIPGTLQSLDKLTYTFLNNNSLTGFVPEWMFSNSGNRFRDLSYNNFTGPREQSCQQLSVNLASSHPTSNLVPWCLRKDLPCPKKQRDHSLFINCGGRGMPVGDNEYEEDLTLGGAASFVSGSDNWAYSSTGTYMNNDRAGFKASNSFNLNVTGAEFYQTARLAPQSLKYYALCMRDGSYKVKLHFAEIMYSNDRNFSSLGRRIFDISIQGNVVLEDFNIMEVAGGVGIGIFKEFDNILVNGSTMEIHLYWKGKGTTAIPDRGVYGPLISAIEIHPNFEVDTGKGWSIGAIVGTVASCVVVILLVLLVLRMRGYLGGERDVIDDELRGLDLQTGHFTLRQIKRATNNFDPTHKIGEGGFGPVYKGVLSDGTVIAVKQLSSKSKQGNREFVNEIGMISALQHANLVRLYGCCIEGKELLLVYEYLENNSLARALFGREDQQMKLDWLTRKKILMGIAKGLCFLHEESRLKIVHRDIKATNVLLDKDLNAKISDFGLAKLDEEENTHISTRIAGTIGYMAPEYAMRGYLTDKADVYSFGVVVLEIVSGKSNTNYRPKEEFVYLLDWAYVLQEQENLLELVDPKLGTSYSKKEALRILNIGLLCTNPSPTLRPPMSSVVGMLDGKVAVKAPIVKRDTMNQDARFKAFEILSQDSQTNLSTFSKENLMHKSNSINAPWTDSSISLPSHDETRDPTSSSKLLTDLDDQ